MGKRLITLFVLSLAVMAAGCSLVSGERDNVARFFELSEAKSDAKVLEDYVTAEETTLFYALRPDDDFEENMASIVSLPEENNPFDFGVFEEYRKNLSEFGLSYEEDIRTLWESGKGRIAYAVTKNDKDEESIYLALSITNDDQYKKVFDLLAGKQGYSANSFKDQDILFNEEDDFFMTRVGNLMIISNSMDNIRNIINVEEEGTASIALRYSQDYQRVLNHVKEDYWMWLYLDSARILESDLPESGLANYIFYGDEKKVLKRSFYATKHDEDKIFVRGVALQEDDAFEAAMPFEFYLDREMPSEKVIFYMEKANIADLIDRAVDAGLMEDVDLFKRYVSAFGFEYETDIKPVLANNVAIALYDTGFVMPNIVMMADVSGAKEGADKIMAKLNRDLGAYAVSLSQENLVLEREKELLGDIVSLDEVSAGEGKLMRITVDTKKFAKAVGGSEPAEESNFAPEKLELYYGIVGDRLILALYSGFDQIYKQDSLADMDEYKEASEVLSEKGGMNMVFDMESLMNNVSRLNAFLASLNQPSLTADSFDAYENYADQIRPFKAMYLRGRDRWGTHNVEMLLTF